MTRRNTPQSARKRYVDSLQSALGCITESRLSVLGEPRENAVGSVVLNNTEPVLLRTNPPVNFFAMQEFRLIRDPEADQGPFRATTVRYSYSFESVEGQEILVFHWTPEASNSGERTFPHLHVGQGVLRQDQDQLARQFSKLHIPTDRVLIEWVVRFAIEELGVKPIVLNWQERLEAGQRLFERYRRKGFGRRIIEAVTGS